MGKSETIGEMIWYTHNIHEDTAQERYDTDYQYRSADSLYVLM